MRYDWLLEPVTEAEPSGPDLDESGDGPYLDYVLTAGSRLPARYYKPDPFSRDRDIPFDRNSIRMRDELARIGELLKATRDLRLLTLEARFQSFSGDIAGFSEVLQAIAGLLETFWSDVHPRGLPGDGADEDDYTLRQNVLSGLDDWWQIVQPLQHLPLIQDGRLGPVPFRLHAVASGAQARRPDDPAVDAATIQRVLADPANAAQTEASFAALAAARGALGRIGAAFDSHAGYGTAPGFERIAEALGAMLALLQAARPDLVLPEPAVTGDGADDAGEAPPQDETPDDEPVAAIPRPTGRIADHAAASAALEAIERYFVTIEPSSPALIIVHQARMLVGKSLVEAIETLMPDLAAKAVIRFPNGLDFRIPMPLMKSLTADAAAAAGKAASVSAAPRFDVAARPEALQLLADVEGFFKAAEPSSPIPVLLAKASGFTSLKFDMIIKELIAPGA